jgi:hypothetical protein
VIQSCILEKPYVDCCFKLVLIYLAIVCTDLDSIDRMSAMGVFAGCFGVYFSYGIFER